MEFSEKLLELRKSKGLTQEELAEVLFVSRTAISKWESGRGYPNIDSLKEISKYFSVSIDDLLSADKILSIAENENRKTINNLCQMLFGVTDIFFILLILLPLYPKTINDYIYSVNLWMYTETAFYNRVIYWFLFITLILCGIIKLYICKNKTKYSSNLITFLSFILNMITILYLILAREAYAASLAFLLMFIKVFLLFKSLNTIN